MRNLQIYASGQNLFTLTKYSWWDPEVNSQGGAILPQKQLSSKMTLI